jgi:hypothetical protein
MQAIKQAAREGDFAKLDALCEEWSVSTAVPDDGDSTSVIPIETDEEAVASPGRTLDTEPRKKVESKAVSEVGREASIEVRR